MKNLGDGNFGMFACDINHDGQFTASDFNAWLVDTKAVITGYVSTDCNLDGGSTASDFNLWLSNTKAVATSQAPTVVHPPLHGVWSFPHLFWSVTN